MLTMTPMLGATTISQSALAVVRALENEDWGTALEHLGKYTGAELAEVARQAVVLGAEASAIETLVGTLGQGEVIEVTGEAPAPPVLVAQPRPFPWLWLLLAAGVVGCGIYRYRKLGKLL